MGQPTAKINFTNPSPGLSPANDKQDIAETISPGFISVSDVATQNVTMFAPIESDASEIRNATRVMPV